MGLLGQASGEWEVGLGPGTDPSPVPREWEVGLGLGIDPSPVESGTDPSPVAEQPLVALVCSDLCHLLTQDKGKTITPQKLVE